MKKDFHNVHIALDNCRQIEIETERLTDWLTLKFDSFFLRNLVGNGIFSNCLAFMFVCLLKFFVDIGHHHHLSDQRERRKFKSKWNKITKSQITKSTMMMIIESKRKKERKFGTKQNKNRAEKGKNILSSWYVNEVFLCLFLFVKRIV